MSYIINKTDGSILVTLNDGTVDTTTDLVLIGKNYSGYGEYQNENFVKLLENFKNTSAPATPLEGQIWYDSANKSIKVYNGTGFKLPPVASSSSTAPTNKNTGDLWYDSTNQQLNFWDGAAWKVIGPAYSASLGTVGDVYDTISNGVTTYPVIKKFLAGNLISVISKDSQFTPSPSVAGFPTIRPGYNISANYSMNVLDDLFVSGDATVTGTINGNATSSSTIAVIDTPTAGTYYLTFTTGTTGNQTLRTDASTLTYDPSTDTLNVGNISGSITNATNATNASNIAVTNTTTTAPATTYYLTFTTGTTGNQTLRTDSSTLTYDPTGNSITANLSGTATAATTATTATNLAGGATGSIPYQTSSGTTDFLAIGTNNYVLTSTGTGLTWTSTGTATNVTVTPENAGTLHYLTFVTNSTSSGQLLKIDTSTLTYNAVGNTITANLNGTASKATYIAGGTTGSIPYQTASDTTAFLAVGANNYVLTSNGTGIQWSAIPTPAKATNIAGGSAGSVPYQTASDTTAFLPIGTSGKVLQSTGSAVQWADVGMPTGAVIPYAGSSAPTGWVLCDGSSYTTASQGALYAVIGYTYGGSGANFLVPNLNGRVVAGVDSAGTTLSFGTALGATGGTQTHTLTIAEMPSHTHDNVGYGSQGNSGTIVNTMNEPYNGYVGSTGGSQAHNNVQPTIILNYIIKI